MARDREKAELAELVHAGTSVLVHGEPGVGKSWLVREVTAGLDDGWHVERVAGTAATAHIAFSASSHLLPEHPAVAEPALVATVTATLFERAGDRRFVLVVDDLNRLDAGTTAIVHQIASRGGLVVASARTGELSAPSVEPLWKQEWAESYVLRNVDQREYPALLTAMVGRPSPQLAAELWRLSDGNPLVTTELLREITSGAGFESTGDGLVAVGAVPVPKAALDLVRSRRDALTPSTRRALDIVALVEPVHHRLVEALDLIEHVTELEAVGLTRSAAEHGAVAVRCAHPMLGDAARTLITPIRQAELCVELLATVDAGDVAIGRLDVLRLARLALLVGADIPAPVREVAAQEALGTFDVASAMELIAPIDPGERSAMAHLIEGRCRIYAGEVDDALASLRRAEDTAADEVGVATAISAQAEVALFLQRDPVTARELLSQALARTSDKTARGELAGVLGLAAGAVGDFGPALELGDELIGDDAVRPAAELALIVTNTLAQGMIGPSATARSRLERGMRLAPALRGANPVAETQLGLNAMFVDFAMLELDEAIEKGRAGLASALANGLPAAEWRVVLANCLLAADGAEEAHQLTDDGRRELASFDPFGLLANATALHALAAVRLGDTAAARDALTAVDALPSVVETRARVWRDLAEAELVAAADRRRAATIAATIAREATDESHHLWAVSAAHAAGTLGAPSAPATLDLIHERSYAAPLVSVLRDGAHARTAGDAATLDRCAEALVAGGYRRFALDFIVSADGVDDDPVRRVRRAASLHSSVGASSALPPHRPDLPLDPLTEREREIASAAADGDSSKAIAEALYVSVRTVDNHLGRVYAKLGVASRADLADVMTASPWM